METPEFAVSWYDATGTEVLGRLVSLEGCALHLQFGWPLTGGEASI